MKKYFLITMFFVFLSTIANSQSPKVLFTKKDLINKFHTIDELEDLGKGELVNIYTERIKELSIVLPFIAIATKPDQQLQDLGVRESSSNLKLLSKHKENQKEYLKSNEEIVSEFIAYSDTDNIIWAILYAEDIIKNIRLGFKGSF